MLQFEVDRYGKFARFTNIADILEMAARKGRRVNKSKVEAWLKDLGVTAKRDLLLEEGQLSMTEAVDLVFDVLDERSSILGNLYPFSTSRGVLSCLRRAPCTYYDILGLTLAHAHRIATKHAPTDLFEKVVEAALEETGWKAAQVGEGRTTFRTTLAKAGSAIGVATSPDAAVHSRAANDEGADVIARLPMFRDERDTHFLVVGQATIEKSTGWEKKANEVKPRRWRKYLGSELEPVRFFAVPHHVESLSFAKVVEGTECIVLDRLRLAQMLRSPPKGTRTIWNAVAREPVEVWQ